MQSKKWYASKIIWAAIAAAFTAIGLYAGGEIGLEALVGLLLKDTIFVILRFFTSKPIVAPKVPPTAALAFVLCLALVAGCTSVPDGMYAEEDGMLAQAQAPGSGDAESDASDVDTSAAPAFSYMGDAESTSILAGWKEGKQNTGTGSLVTGFVQGLTAEQSARIQEVIDHRLETDPALAFMVAELDDLREVPVADRDQFWYTRVDNLLAACRVAADNIVSQLGKTGQTGNLELGNLEQIIVVGLIHSNVGHDETQPTADESEAMRYFLSNIISAGRGEAVIVPPGGEMEEGEEEEGTE